MLTDDDFPDYFVDDDDDDAAADAGRRRSDEPVHAGDTISFGPDSSDAPASSATATTGGSRRLFGPLLLFVVVAASLIAYFRYLSPCVDDAVMDVYVTRVERRGVLFKTYEADVVDPAAVDAPASAPAAGAYTHPVSVSVATDSVARAMTALQGSGRKVRLHYRRYYGTLPWRGESKIVVTSIDP